MHITNVKFATEVIQVATKYHFNCLSLQLIGRASAVRTAHALFLELYTLEVGSDSGLAFGIGSPNYVLYSSLHEMMTCVLQNLFRCHLESHLFLGH